METTNLKYTLVFINLTQLLGVQMENIILRGSHTLKILNIIFSVTIRLQNFVCSRPAYLTNTDKWHSDPFHMCITTHCFDVVPCPYGPPTFLEQWRMVSDDNHHHHLVHSIQIT